jgi:hypothetical protein
MISLSGWFWKQLLLFELLEIEHSVFVSVAASEDKVDLSSGESILGRHPPAMRPVYQPVIKTNLNSSFVIFPSPFLSNSFQAFLTWRKHSVQRISEN